MTKYDGERALALLAALLDFIDKGILVRSTSFDHESGWAMRQIALVSTLAESKELVDSQGVTR